MSFASAPPRWRDVYLAAGARGVSTLGDFLAATALVLALQGAGAGGWAVAGVLLASTLPPVLLAPLTGRMADRYDSRKLITAAGLSQAAVCTGLAYTHGVVPIITLVAMLAAGLAVSNPTFTALTPVMVGRDNLPRAMSIGQAAGAVGMLVAPALAGVLVGGFGLRLPLLLDAATYLAVVVAGLALRTRRGGRYGTGDMAAGARTGAGAGAGAGSGASGGAGAATGGPAGPASTVAAARRWTWRGDPLMLAVLVLLGAFVAAVNATSVADVFLIRSTLHASSTAYGLVTALYTGMMLIGSAAAGGIRSADGRLANLLVGLLATTCLQLVAVAAVPSLGWLLPLMVLGGLVNGGENVLAGVIVFRRAPAHLRGRISATVGAVTNGANAVGFLIGGALLAAGLPPRGVFAITGVAGLVAVAACWPGVLRAGRREVTGEPARIPAGVPAAGQPVAG